MVGSADLRHTDRRPTRSASVNAADLRRIVAAVGSAGARLHLLGLAQVLDLAAADHAQRTEADDVASQAEIGYWTGGTRPLGSGTPDAVIPDRAWERRHAA